MNIKKIGCQKRLQQNHVLVNDYYNFEYAQRCFSQQQFGAQKKPHQMGIFEGGSHQQSLIHANSSSSTMNRIGSPGSVFYATERFMGFPQYDYEVDNNSPLCPEISKNYDAQILPPYQQSGDGFYTDQSLEQASPNSVSLQSAAKTNTCSNIYSEKERILQLKRKLLEGYDTLDNKTEVSIPFDGNSGLSFSSNSCAYQLEHTRQSARTCSNAAAPSGSSVMSTKTRIRWSQSLHDRFVECVTRLGGAEKATPKAILSLMDSEGLTIYHVKSHLQKYRIAKYTPDSAEGKSERRASMNDVKQIDIKTGLQLKEALQLQLDVQRRLHEQIEIQRNLQLRIEEQGKQLKLMFNRQEKANKSVLKTQTSNDKSPDDPSSTSLEHVQILIAEGSENSQFPSKIS